jgi:biotin carboxyl carrier protein
MNGAVTAGASGRVKTIFHNTGDIVRRGDLIALLENEQ